MILPSILFLVALVVNLNDRKMLALVCVVGAGFFLPIPRYTADIFYTCAILDELTVCYLARKIACPASKPIILICACMVICHLAGMILDGYPVLSAYRILIPFLENATFVVCILFCRYLSNVLYNHESPPI